MVGEGVDQGDRSHGPVTAEVKGTEEQAKVYKDQVGEGERLWQGWRVASRIVELGEHWQRGTLEQQAGCEEE